MVVLAGWRVFFGAASAGEAAQKTLSSTIKIEANPARIATNIRFKLKDAGQAAPGKVKIRLRFPFFVA